MDDKDLAAALAAIQTSILTVNERVTNIFIAVQAIRLSLSDADVPPERFDDAFRLVKVDYEQRMKHLEAQALEAAELARRRRLLENFEGEPQ
jgi:hypothetical protein